MAEETQEEQFLEEIMQLRQMEHDLLIEVRKLEENCLEVEQSTKEMHKAYYSKNYLRVDELCQKPAYKSNDKRQAKIKENDAFGTLSVIYEESEETDGLSSKVAQIMNASKNSVTTQEGKKTVTFE